MRTLSQRLLDRRLFKSELRNAPFDPAYIERVKAETLQKIGQADWLPYFFYEKGLSTKTYKYDTKEDDGIRVWRKDGQVVDLTTVSELLDRHFVMKADEKYLLCHV